MNSIEATRHSSPPRRAPGARAVVPLALAGLLLAPLLGHALPRASASTLRPVVLLNASGTALTPSTLLSAPFHEVSPVTVAWKVAAADAAGLLSQFTVGLTDARGHIQSRLVATTRAGRASATTEAACARGCYLKMSVANMEYAIVGYTLAAAQ